MNCQLRSNLWRSLAVMAGQLLTGLQVKQSPTLIHQVTIKRVLIKRMSKPVARRQRPVWQFFFAESYDQPMRLFEVGQAFLEIDLINVKQIRHNSRKELRAFDAGVLQST